MQSFEAFPINKEVLSMRTFAMDGLAGMLLHIKGKVTIGKLKLTILS
jgi:hypothetical protein